MRAYFITSVIGLILTVDANLTRIQVVEPFNQEGKIVDFPTPERPTNAVRARVHVEDATLLPMTGGRAIGVAVCKRYVSKG